MGIIEEHIGLGIDAGGTYTDAVLYDLSGDKLLGKHKSLTTKWNYALGIEAALQGLDPLLLRRVRQVALSTTLATNAIVENDGQRVGLMIMPPYGRFNPEDIDLEPLAVIPGRLDIDGSEIESIHVETVRNTAIWMKEEKGAAAFAVSGFAGSINPAHELAVRDIVLDATGCHVTCGHELSDLLNFRTRAYTAVYNARLIPKLVTLLRQLETVLSVMEITAPIAVVKGDGTLMSAQMAVERPVETILSGPAASVSGARHLTGLTNAVVVDIGGTTTDTAALENGAVKVSERGSCVGGRQTHVRALAIRTVGLGGDSLIRRTLSGYEIGPRRVVPVSWAGKHCPGMEHALAFARQFKERFTASAANMLQLLFLSNEPEKLPSDAARKTVALLRRRPHTLGELVEKTGAAYEGGLDIDDLERCGNISRIGLTPVDLLHIMGKTKRWDTDTAHQYFELFTEDVFRDDARKDPEEMTNTVTALMDQVTRSITLELIKAQFDEKSSPDALDTCPMCQAFLSSLFSCGQRHFFTLSMSLDRPVIGIGAPAEHFLPKATAYLNSELIIPTHADVANAIGAITSHVSVLRRLTIQSDSSTKFTIVGVAGNYCFNTLEMADTFARKILCDMVIRDARKAGTESDTVHYTVKDHFLNGVDGDELLKSRIITAHIKGKIQTKK